MSLQTKVVKVLYRLVSVRRGRDSGSTLRPGDPHPRLDPGTSLSWLTHMCQGPWVVPEVSDTGYVLYGDYWRQICASECTVPQARARCPTPLFHLHTTIYLYTFYYLHQKVTKLIMHWPTATLVTRRGGLGVCSFTFFVTNTEIAMLPQYTIQSSHLILLK